MPRPLRIGVCGRMFPPATDALAAAKRAEEDGWDFLNYPDQISGTHPTGLLQTPVVESDPAAPSAMYSDVWFGSFEMCAAAAAVTGRIGLTLAVVDLLRRSPALMAQEMATLHHLSGGRITFALGSGEAKQFAPYGEKRVKPNAKLEESIRVFKALWSSGGEPISRDSEFWPLRNAVFPLAQYREADPPILLVGGTPELLRIAGELCEGWFTFLPGGTLDDADVLAQTINTVKSTAAAAGRDPEDLRFAAQVFASIAATDEEAWELARRPPVAWLGVIGASIAGGAGWKKWGYEHPFGDFNWARDMDITLIDASEAAQLVEKVPDEILDHTCVWGSPERVAARLSAFIDAGINELALFNFAAAAEPAHATQWNRLASEILVQLGHAPLTNLERSAT
jgi:phthiodiolone/phenolphthiodiolone dimycocerosates ketoreductase